MDEHYISLGSIFMVFIFITVSAVGGTILFLTYRHWQQEKQNSESSSK